MKDGRRKVSPKASLRVTASIKERSRLSKEEWREYTKTVWHIANTSHPEHPAVFPLEIPKRLIKLFTFVGETVLDPFAGSGSTAHAALALGRRVICIDQNRRYVEIIRSSLKSRFNGRSGKDWAQLAVADSRKMPFLASGSVGLIVTSPPYWNKANYGRSRSNLGQIAQYKQFLQEITPAFAECFRVLKPGRKLALVTANVNQHTDHGLLTFPLAADFSMILRGMGFVMVNEVIWSKDGTGGKWGSWGSQRPIFGSYPYPPNFLFKNVHEHILIFARPPAKAVRGPKAVSYAETMGLNGKRPNSGAG